MVLGAASGYDWSTTSIYHHQSGKYHHFNCSV